MLYARFWGWKPLTDEQGNNEEKETFDDVQIRNLDGDVNEEAALQPDPRRHHNYNVKHSFKTMQFVTSRLWLTQRSGDAHEGHGQAETDVASKQQTPHVTSGSAWCARRTNLTKSEELEIMQERHRHAEAELKEQKS